MALVIQAATSLYLSTTYDFPSARPDILSVLFKHPNKKHTFNIFNKPNHPTTQPTNQPTQLQTPTQPNQSPMIFFGRSKVSRCCRGGWSNAFSLTQSDPIASTRSTNVDCSPEGKNTGRRDNTGPGSQVNMGWHIGFFPKIGVGYPQNGWWK